MATPIPDVDTRLKEQAIANREHNDDLGAKKVIILDGDGNQVVPAGSSAITYNYIQSEETATYKYYGYASSTGWQIKRKTLATGVWEIDAGLGDYDTAWAARATHTYSYT